MTAILGLLLGAVVVGIAAPRWLAFVESSCLNPTVALFSWWSAVLGVIGTTVLALAMLVLPDRAGPAPIGQLADLCVAALSHAGNPRLEDMLAVGTTGILAFLVVRTTRAVVRTCRRQREHMRAHLGHLALLGKVDAHILWIPHTKPMAFCVAGSDPMIVASTGLQAALPTRAVRAVLAHERAHLSGRHHLQVALAEALAAAMPGVPLFARAPAAVRRLTEFAADARAAQLHGSQSLLIALRVLSGEHASPPGALNMSGGDVQARMLRLQPARLEAVRFPGRMVGTACVALSAVLPGAAAAAMTASAVLLACI